MSMQVLKTILRDQLWLYSKRAVSPEVALSHMSGLVDILERHPSLGATWGEKADAILRDMSEALADLEE